MKKFMKKHYDYISMILSSVLSIGISFAASVLFDLLKGENKTNTSIFIMVSLLVFVFLFILFFAFLSKQIKKSIFKDSNFNDYIQKAYLTVQDYTQESQSLLHKKLDNDHQISDLKDWYLDNLQLAINKCYDFFYSSFGGGKILVEETKFEVTFMTLSYRDGKITIPCSCNKEKRTPTSMLSRKDNPEIYRNTITAQIYDEYLHKAKPSFRLIEDTTSGYEFIYDNQKNRIKSTVVLPVLSSKNNLLGTLVVHCNTKKFFRQADEDFWYEILQLFACELSEAKILLDYSYDKNNPPF